MRRGEKGKHMIKTISQVKEGNFRILPEMTFNFETRMIFLGAEFDGTTYPCAITFDEVFADVTPENKTLIANIFIKAKRIAVNAGIQPDIPVQDSEIEDLL